MTPSATRALITDSATSFGTEALLVLGAVIAIGVGLLVFYFGWKTLTRIDSSMLGSDYFEYKGNVKNSFASDRMERNAIKRGRKMNKRDGLSF